MYYVPTPTDEENNMTSILRINETELRSEYNIMSQEFQDEITVEIQKISERKFEIEVHKPFRDMEDSVVQGILLNQANGVVPAIIRFYDNDDKFAFQLPCFLGSEI